MGIRRLRVGPAAASLPQRLGVHAALLLLCVPAMLPFLWMLSTSFKLDSQIYGVAKSGSSVMTLSSFIPHPFHPQNYPDALHTVPFASYLFNTLGLCATTVVGAVAASAIVAYGFARLEFKGRQFWFMVMISTMALPGQVTMIPQFAVYRMLGWYGSVFTAYGAGFRRRAVLHLSADAVLPDDSDGTGANRRGWTARASGRCSAGSCCRLSKPALADLRAVPVLGDLERLLGPLIYINDPKKYTLAYGLQQFYSSYDGQWAQLMAAATLFTVPIIMLFFFAQKTFIQGIATTGGRN